MTKSERKVAVNKLLNSKAFKEKRIGEVLGKTLKIYPHYTKMTCIDGQLSKLLLSAVPKNERRPLFLSSLENYKNTLMIGK